MTEPSDLLARQQALDPTESFIVQAPAGSGKTSLLTQRFLTLLAGVSKPEEILAITFTKKAAGEMRERILDALELARTSTEPSDPHQAQTWRLATQALTQNDALGWGLEENPARLRVLTIDALCARLAAGLPILSQFGASPKPTDDAHELYNQAARQTLEAVYNNRAAHQDAVATLLLHLDNDLLRIQKQVAQMLAQRDKWMRPLMKIFGDLHRVGPSDLRVALEQTLREIVESHLERLNNALGPQAVHTLSGLCRFALSHLGPESVYGPWVDNPTRPGTEAESLSLWYGFSNLLLSSTGTWRKNADKRVGLPAPKDGRDALQRSEFTAAKEQFKTLSVEFTGNEPVRELLADLMKLPPHRYSDSQWEVLQALLEVSRFAAAELTLVFKDRARTDFSEVAHRAVRALGSDEEPTDLAMALDSKLQHLLVDEFQDTSLGQLELLAKLTQEWVPDEGRTLFLVGDPMQSIYRFRDAEVGLFLKVREHGLGHLSPKPLTLRSNFRSNAELVDWFNQTFQEVFPQHDNPDSGAVSYSLAVAARPYLEPAGVVSHPVTIAEESVESARLEAECVVRIVEETWTEDPERPIAILARTRTHLREILPLLKSRGHRYSGVDLEPLSTRPWIQDLLSLTRALLTLNDRLAWLSVLRAPWCGLSTADLFLIASASETSTIPEHLESWHELSFCALSEDAAHRLARIWGVLQQAVTEQGRKPLREAVEAAWLGLGGPAGLPSQNSLEDCHTFLELLHQVESAQPADPLVLLDSKLERLYAQPDVTADGRLQIMTIHKSKGLEFDTVILPGLANGSRPSDEPLVSWLEWATSEGRSKLLLAPITERGQDRDPVYSYVHSLEKKKEENEAVRLLYVAATRAKRKLHLVGLVEEDLKKDAGTLKTPTSGSFLRLLWPAVLEDFQARFLAPLQKPVQAPQSSSSKVFDIHALTAKLAERESQSVHQAQDLDEPSSSHQIVMNRLSSAWKQPDLPSDFQSRKPELLNEDEQGDSPKFEWAGETVRHVGTVVHRVLQQVGREGLEQWDLDRLESMRGYLRGRLIALGVPEESVQSAVDRALNALQESLTSERGRWILDPAHHHARSEFAVSGISSGRLIRSVVDRTFVDESGVRWVVDFKTGTHLGGDDETFLQREVERYRPQLARYARLLKKLDNRPVKVGLYFPLLRAWREWEVDEPSGVPQQLEFGFE